MSRRRERGGVPVGFWVATLGARGAGVTKELLLASLLGTAPWKDALVAAWTAPALIASYSSETLPALLTPLWVQSGTARGGRRLVLGALALLGLLSCAAMIWPQATIAAIAPGLAGPGRAEAIALERWLGAAVVVLGAQALLTARLNALRRFAWGPLAAGLPALGAVVWLLASGGEALPARMLGLAAALVAGGVLGVLMLALVAWRTRAPAAPAPGRGLDAAAGPDVAPWRGLDAAPWRALGAVLAATLLLNLVPLAERIACSGLSAGSLAAYDYGERLVQLVFTASVAPFTVVSFTGLSAVAGRAALPRQLEQSLRGLLTLVMPLAVMLAVFAPLVVGCVYGRGRFHAASLRATAPVVAIKGGGLGLDAAFYLLLFGLYAGGRASAKLPAAAVLAAVNIPLALAGAARWGLAGVAWAHVAAYAAGLAVLAHASWGWRGLHWRPALRAAALAGGLTLAAALAVRAA
ncbi:MAG: lipid II flippase MurJ, partial [Terriglobales bacterium]